MACPTKRVDTTHMGCAEAASAIYQAYLVAISGNQRISVRFNERWTEYNKANADHLLQQYNTLYNQCPQAKLAGLPNLNPGLKARRGPPLRGFSIFGRM